MSVLTTKILAFFVYPLTLSLFFALLGYLLLLRGWRRLGSGCLGLALVVLWLCSTPVVSDALQASLERVYPPIPVADSPQADAIVVLGGGIVVADPPYRLTTELSGGADRAWQAARLYKAGKAPWILATGGGLRWYGPAQPEAPAILDFLVALGVPERAVLLETESLNTYQNALFSKPIMEAHGIHSILLVTSAEHMPRALAVFRSQGIQTWPAPTDFEIVPVAETTILRWLPDAGALSATTGALREYLGWVAYRLMDWIP
ncbi:MAG: YdcF family protein [Gammaproteobacteria bacterium]|nr:YdcF family protein [Gammaproteobacteria bacterium]